MSLHLIFAPKGGGKTTLVMNEIIAAQEKDGDSCPLVFVVPEQFSLQAERGLIELSKDGCLLRAQVLSPTRLAYHVFAETGGGGKALLTDVGKYMLLRKLLLDNRHRLVFFSAASEKSGFIDQLFQLVSEFFHYGVSEDALMAAEAAADGESLKRKLADLRLIFGEYRRFVSERFHSSDSALDLLAEKLPDAAELYGAEVWIDGFLGFVPQEYRVIEGLLRITRRVTVTLDSIPESENELSFIENDSFHEVKKCLAKLRKIAARNNIPVETKTLAVDFRHGDAPALEWLFRNYFDETAVFAADPSPALTLRAAQNIYSEVEAIAVSIKEAVANGQKYRDIGILTGAPDEYADVVRAVFSRYEIPVFIDEKRDALAHPLLETVRALIEIGCDNMSYAAVFRLLKAGLCGFSAEETDILENYVLARGIRGKRWKPDLLLSFPTERIRELHFRAYAIIRDFGALHSTTKRTVRAFTQMLYDKLKGLGAEEVLSGWIPEIAENAGLSALRGHVQIWNKLIDAMDKIVEILGEETVTLDDYRAILETGLSEIKTGIIPPSLDEVIVGDISRSKLPELSDLYVCGANEGCLPKIGEREGLLTDDERRFLDESASLELAPYGLYQINREDYELFGALQKSRRGLNISWRTGGLDGKAFSPAPLVARLREMFPRLSVTHDGEIRQRPSMPERAAISALYLRIPKLLEGAEDGLKPVIDPLTREILARLKDSPDFQKRLGRIAAAIRDGYRPKSDKLSKKLIDRLYQKNELRLSVSKLEAYAECPFSYFLRYNLSAGERKIYSIERVDLGTLYHEVLDNFQKELSKMDIDWKSGGPGTTAQIDELIDNCFDNYTDENNIFRSGGQYRYIAQRAKEVTRKTAEIILSHMRSGDFNFEETEIGFGEKSEFPPVELATKSGRRLLLEGKIDRLDSFEIDMRKYIKVIDYKSSARKFSLTELYYGLQLQLAVYMNAYIRQYKKKYGGGEEPIPAALFYFHVDNPFAEVKDALPEYEIAKKFKMSGIVLNDENIIRALDREISRHSSIIPVEMVRAKESGNGEGKKNVSPDKKVPRDTGSVFSIDDFRAIMDFSFDKAAEIGDKIIGGEVSATPCCLEKHSGCAHCEYSSVCKFDKVDDRSFYNFMPPINASQELLSDFSRRNPYKPQSPDDSQA